jgi:undecaprenyl-diphosphatase
MKTSMDTLQSITLGLIQGITEWLPISSTGHLRVAEHFFGLTVPLLFDVLLHGGTLLVLFIYFRIAIKNMLLSFWHRDFHSEDGKLILPILVGSIPTAAIALLIGEQLDSYFSSLFWLGGWFIVSGILLLATRFTSERTSKISFPIAFIVGLMQGLAIVPSASRSGFTIATMLLLGVKREVAFKFSFLLSIPAIIGALGLTIYQQHNILFDGGISNLEVLVAMAVAVGISFLALKVLEKSLSANKFYLFSIYCLAIGTLMLILDSLGF